MAGRNRDTTQIVIEKTIKTKAWYSFILNKSGHKNYNQLASVFDQGKRKWANYANGSRSPQPSTLKRAEKLYSGSLNTFNSGPELSALFECMFVDLNDPRSLRWLSDTDHQWLSTAQRELKPDQVILYLDKIRKTKAFQQDPIEVHPDSPLHFLSGCCLLFRIAARNNRQSKHRYTYNLIDLILKFHETDELSKELDTYDVKSEFMSWLLFHALAWCSENTTYMATFFSEHPDFIGEDGWENVTQEMILDVANSFLKNPRDFTNKLNELIDFEEKRHYDFLYCIPPEFRSEPKNYGLAKQL